jgi:hypothetical protein
MWLVWIGLAIVLILLAVGAILWRSGQTGRGDPVRLEAQRAVEALKTGLDLRNVILRCYEQMSLALQREQDIKREEAMTAREFERLLQARGIPREPVHQLTLLFEVARYGHRLLAPEDEQKAYECLNAIVRYSGEKKQVSG